MSVIDCIQFYPLYLTLLLLNCSHPPAYIKRNTDILNIQSEADDETLWFPTDLFTDEMDFSDLPNSNAAEVVSQSSRADNSTTYSDELELETFEEVPETIDVPKCKKPRIEESPCSSEHQCTNFPLLASWQSNKGEQFSFKAPLAPPPPMATPNFVPSAPAFMYSMSVKVNKADQCKNLLAILCENISSDPNQSVQDLMTLRLLLIRPHLTPEESHLLDTVLVLFESYLSAGRSRPDIATMAVRDFSFHFRHQAQSYVAAMSAANPRVQTSTFGGYDSQNAGSQPSFSMGPLSSFSH